MSIENSLAGRVALVTGSSTGLGLGIALRLGQAGAKVAMNFANNQERAARGFAQLEATGAECHLTCASIIEAGAVNRLVEEVRDRLGPIDIVVANATPDQPQLPIEKYDWTFYQSMIDYFIKSPFLLAQALLPSMKARKWGRFVNIGTEAFQLAMGNFSAYVAAKGGQVGWTRSMATELAPYGITVNIVAPGWIPVERHATDPQAAKDAYLATIPMKRWGTPDDVADAVLYFARDEASFVTGQTLCVNGGKTPW